MKHFTAISLFCGAGGLDLGFSKAGFKTIWANDFNRDACNTFHFWNACPVIQGDIKKVSNDEIPNADILLGSLPCQGFSLSGPRKLNDERNILYKEYVRILQAKQPNIFVSENVKGLLSMGNGQVIEAIIQAFSEQGYNLFYQLVNASDYGVPQDRERVIICGFHKSLGITNFMLEKPQISRSTLQKAIGNISDIDIEKDVCLDAYSSRYMSRNRKRKWNEVSFTIPAMAKQVPLWPGSPDMVKISTDKWKFGEGFTRRLSWQEVAAIQTFPKHMMFSGNLRSVYKQIGNAVPCKLATYIGKEIYKILLDRG